MNIPAKSAARRGAAAALAVVALLGLTACASTSPATTVVTAEPTSTSGGSATMAPAGSTPGTVTATLVAKVAPPDPGTFGTNLEGAAFDAHGHFYFVDTTAPAGHPKLMQLDLDSRSVSDLDTDSSSMLNCIGFAPNGAMHLCDLKGGRVVSYNPAAHTLTDMLTRVGTSPLVPDDLAVDRNGDLVIADYQGTPTSPTGRVVLRTANGAVTVAAGGLVHPNGIALAPDGMSVWVDEDLVGRLDHIGPGVSSPASTTPEIVDHTAAYLSLGANAYADSLTLDGAGHLYLAVYGAHEILEFDPNGVQVGRVSLPAAVPNVTHVAIRPGSRDAYVTASGPGGGYIYRFTALAPAPANVPNGG